MKTQQSEIDEAITSLHHALDYWQERALKAEALLAQHSTRLQQLQPLSDEAIIRIGKKTRAIEEWHILPVTFARAIERAHGIGGDK